MQGTTLILLLAGYALHAVRWRWLLAGKSPFIDTFHAVNVGHLYIHKDQVIASTPDGIEHLDTICCKIDTVAKLF